MNEEQIKQEIEDMPIEEQTDLYERIETIEEKIKEIKEQIKDMEDKLNGRE